MVTQAFTLDLIPEASCFEFGCMCLRWISPVRINVSARITGIKYVGEMLTIMGTGGVSLNLTNYLVFIISIDR